MKKTNIVSLLIAVLVLCVQTMPASALQGMLDPSFSGNGYDTITASTADNYDMAIGITLQPDGKLIAVGADTEDTTVVRRYKTNGELDTTFGNGGTFGYNFASYPGASSEAYRAALQSDGKILVVGKATMDNGAGGWRQEALIFRLTSNGILDTSFSTDGYATYANFGAATVTTFWDAQITSDNKLYATAISSTHGVLVRFNGDVLDSTFNGNGYVLSTATSGGNDLFRDLRIDAQSKVVVVGKAQTSGLGAHYDMAVWRFNANGTADTSFGTFGVYLDDGAGGQANGNEEARSLTFDSTNIAITGEADAPGPSGPPAIWMLDDSGDLVNGFDGDGVLLLADDQYIQGIDTDGAGNFYVGGGSYVANPNDADSVIWRFDSTGAFDADFGTNGMLTLPNFTAYEHEWSDIDRVLYRDGKVYFNAFPFDNDVTFDYNWVVGRIAVGNIVTDTPAGVTVTNTAGEEITIPLSGTQTLQLAVNSNVPVVEFTADFGSGDVSLDNVTVDTSIEDGKAVVSGLTITHSLFIPKRVGDTAAIVCPHAQTLAEVGVGCEDQQAYTEGDANVSIVTINGQDYWKIDGLTGTGGVSISAPNTGLAFDTGVVQPLLLGVGLAGIAFGRYETRKRILRSW